MAKKKVLSIFAVNIQESGVNPGYYRKVLALECGHNVTVGLGELAWVGMLVECLVCDATTIQEDCGTGDTIQEGCATNTLLAEQGGGGGC